MGRRARQKRLAREALMAGREASSPPRQGAGCAAGIFLVWMYTLLAVPAGLGLLAAVEPALAALLYRPAEGVLMSFQGGDELHDGLYPVVRYEVGGATYTCTSWICVTSDKSAIQQGDRLRVYYPAGRPAEGFVCDWSEARVGSLWGATGVGLAVIGLTTVFVRLMTGTPAFGLRRFARWWAKALAAWLGCALLGGAAGLVLLGGGNMPAIAVGSAAGGFLGGLLAMRDARHAHAAASA